MADSFDDRPATRGDIAHLAQALARSGEDQAARAEAGQAARLDQTRHDLLAEAGLTRQALRGDLAQIRQELTSRLDTAIAQLDALVEDRDTRLLAVVFLAQVLLGVALALLHNLLT